MRLYGDVDDHRVQKIQIAAQYAQINLNIHSKAKEWKDLQQQYGKTMWLTKPFLCTPDGLMMGQSHAILRYIASLSRCDIMLYGQNVWEQGQVDQWLDFLWNELEVPLCVLDPQTQKVCVPDAQCVHQAVKDVKEKLRILSDHLKDKVYLVGDQITIADIAFVCALHRVIQESAVQEQLKDVDMCEVNRFLNTCVNQREFKVILEKSQQKTKWASPSKKGGKKKNKKSQSSSASSSTPKTSTKDIVDWMSPTAPASAMSNPSVKEKFGRGRLRVKEFLQAGMLLEGQQVIMKGWAKTIRMSGVSLAFLEINDGSTFTGAQVVLTKEETEGFDEATTDSGGVGSSFKVVGTVVKSPAKGQVTEIKCQIITLLGKVHENATYPMSKKRHTLEHLRQHAHLRPRSNIHGAAMRVRNAMAYALHKFFQERGFLYIHTPLITASDCEGAGEMFSVTTLLSSHPDGKLPLTKDNTIDYTKDFFDKPSYLTVSGQLNVETHCCALSDCYTFGPTFRAENSNTSRHLAEFWMLEPEIAFADLEDDMNLAEDMLKYCAQYALDNCSDDIQFFDKMVEKGLINRLNATVKEDFVRITYTEAVELLQKPKNLKKGKFEVKPVWGEDLGSEHERFLTEVVYKKPVCIYDYPKEFKAFYMRLNDDQKTVAAVDILVPKIGEIIGGSQREDRLDVLKSRIVEATGHDPEDYSWYTDLRKYGTVPHAGFGLGFERLIRFVTGIENIRDVIPFPRWPGNADF